MATVDTLKKQLRAVGSDLLLFHLFCLFFVRPLLSGCLLLVSAALSLICFLVFSFVKHFLMAALEMWNINKHIFLILLIIKKHNFLSP